ncbi:MAG: 3'-5' exonuclease [Rikenellaceae bacterium]|jgi:DNA polymerase-3 subunit epsilon|nr:3'-5' exonuclease [Rikenellaceae bacterium]
MQDFAAIDFETANYRPTSICSVGLVIARGGEIVEREHRLIRPTPNYYIRRFSEEIHGIFYADTLDAPAFPEVWAQLSPLMEGLPLVAHNKNFDESVLKATCDNYGLNYPGYEFYCTLSAARRHFPKQLIGNHRLPTVCAHLGIDFTNHHHALADAEGCAQIALKIL